MAERSFEKKSEQKKEIDLHPHLKKTNRTALAKAGKEYLCLNKKKQ